MTALIVEDVKTTSDLIKERIKLVSNDFTSLEQAFTLIEAYDKILLKSYDIIFWDINMSTGTSFDLLKRLATEDKITFENIFITGEKESEFIISALKFSAIDYLYKPLDDNELKSSIEKAILKRNKTKESDQIELLLDFLTKNGSQNKKVAFNLIKGNVVYVNLEDITFLEADGVITKIFLNDCTCLNASKNLGFYKSFLLNENHFFLASHSAIINARQIENFDQKNLTINFKNKLTTAVSRRRVKDYKDFMKNDNNTPGIIDKILNRFK